MRIKSDKWIRRMAASHGMIEPAWERYVTLEHFHCHIVAGVALPKI